MNDLPPPRSAIDDEPESEERWNPGRALLVLAGIVALIGAGAAYVKEYSKSDLQFAYEPNYAL